MMRKTAYLGIFLSLALIFSYIEVLIPIPIGIPGIKLGLANLVILFALYFMGEKEAILLSLARILISAFLFGNVVAMAYSFCGGMLSLLVMAALKKTEKLSVYSVSIAGGVFHNLGQILIAAVLVNNYNVFYYLPVLMIAGFLTGGLIGIVARQVFLRIGNRKLR